MASAAITPPLPCSRFMHLLHTRKHQSSVFALPHAPQSSPSQSSSSSLPCIRRRARAAAHQPHDVQVKISVGPVNSRSDQNFSFHRKLGASSDIVVVTLSKPLGIVLELSKIGTRRVFVSELIPGGNADRASRVAQLFESKQKSEGNQGRVILGGGVKPGDLLRATTMVNVVVDLFGLRAPQRVVSLFEADGRTWAETMAAIQTSFIADGPVTLVLERES